MKYNCFFTLLLLLNFSIQSQETTDLTFDKELNKVLLETNDQEYKIYEVKTEVYSEIIQTNTRKITQEYKDALAQFELAKKDSLQNIGIENYTLKVARKRLKSVDKYMVIKSRARSITYNVFSLGKEIEHPEEQISGNFKDLGEFSLVDEEPSFCKNQLVEVKEAEDHLTSKEVNNKTVLIQNKKTKSVFLVEPNFIKKFASSNVASMGFEN